MITIQKFDLYSLKVSEHVKISVECFENFGGGISPPGCAPGVRVSLENCNCFVWISKCSV